jgi:bacterial/archaeal transporter family-2 protein
LQKILFILAAMAVGGLVALQPGLNSEVAKRLGTPFGASFLSIMISFILATGFFVATRQSFVVANAASMPWYLWFAGFVGFIFVIASLALAPILGASLLFAAVIAGQLLVAAVIDMTGFGGYQAHGFDPWRFLGVGLVLAGVLVFQRAS